MYADLNLSYPAIKAAVLGVPASIPLLIWFVTGKFANYVFFQNSGGKITKIREKIPALQPPCHRKAAKATIRLDLTLSTSKGFLK